MANSLIELYGGGMAGKSNNYQLGGRIASARRGREYQGEMRALQKKKDDADKRKAKSGLLGSIGSITLGTLGQLTGIPGGREAGAALGRYFGESTYAKSDFGGGKYAQQTREDLTEGEKDFRKGMGERALVTGLQAAIMPEMYEKGSEWLKGLGGAGEAAATAAGATTPAVVDATSAAIVPPVSAPAVDLGAYTGTASQNLAMARELGLDLTGGQTVRGAYETGGYGPWSTAMETYGDLFGRGGGWIPKMQAGGRAGTEYDPTRPQQQQQKQNPFGGFDASNIFTGFGPGSFTGSNLYGGQGAFQYAGDTGVTGSGGTFNPSAGYGTATGAIGALQQMGMGDVASDPRLQKYLKDLPQFSMGYEQKVGDYRTGAQQGLLGLAQSGASGAGGFAGSGAATTQAQQQRQQMVDQFGRQRRGVVEGYQADVLSAIADIERKGEFEFGGGWSDADTSKASSLVKDALSTIQSKLPATGTDANQSTIESDPMQDWYDQQYG